MPTSTAPLEVPPYATDGNYAAGGETWSATPRRVATNLDAWAAEGATPEELRLSQSENEFLGRVSEGLAWLRGEAGTAVFGDGSDGDVTASGITIARDMYFNNLTVPNGETVNMSGFRLFVLGLLVVEAGGVIHNDGSDGGVGTGGAGGAQGSIGGGGAGGDGLVTTQDDGGAGVGQTAAIGGSGGTGGASAPEVAGASGTAVLPTPNQGGIRHAAAALGYLSNNTLINGGGGGGGGASSGADSTSGSGGGGGGILAIWANQIDNRGEIRANGGSGSNAAATTAGCGGGGGGGGGGVFIAHRVAVGGTLGTITATGGALGTGTGDGDDGTAGADGTIVTLVA